MAVLLLLLLIPTSVTLLGHPLLASSATLKNPQSRSTNLVLPSSNKALPNDLNTTSTACRRPPSYSIHDIANPPPFRIPRTTTTLEFFHLGAPIPEEDLMQELVGAMEYVAGKLEAGLWEQHIPHGMFGHNLRVHDGTSVSVVSTTMCDFEQLGRSMDWMAVGNVLRGLALWLESVWHRFQELNFNVVVDGRGMVGFGFIRLRVEGAVGGGVWNVTAA